MFNDRKLASKKSQSCLSDMDAAGEKRKFEEKWKSMAEEKTHKKKNNVARGRKKGIWIFLHTIFIK